MKSLNESLTSYLSIRMSHSKRVKVHELIFGCISKAVLMLFPFT